MKPFPSSLDSIPDSIKIHFRELNLALERKGILPLSLNPDKESPSSFLELLETLPDTHPDPNDLELVLHFFDACIHSILENYPENIYWDLDFLFYHVYKQLKDKESFSEKQGWIMQLETRVKHIMDIFGSKSKIQFRYIHDFLYGFDWCKWVRKQKESGLTEEYNPFGEEFLTYIESRGLEILDMIEENDQDYVPLQSGTFRNPFVFKRGTEEEKMLLSSLAETKDIPIFAWKVDAKYNTKKDYSQIRKERADALGIAPNRMPGAHKKT